MSFDPVTSEVGAQLPQSATVEERLTRLEQNQIAMGVHLTENTNVTKASNALLGDIKAIFEAVKMGLRVLGWIGIAAKWLGSIAVGVGTVVGFWHYMTHR